ncbi:MAG: deoxyribose-phosphate aldolase [Bacteroidales bacterium]|nr:deoxyribose-phosphate aldolase [Bacteroidales bacterium]MBP3343936.1 deoxyribose-phosphate aldolase [Bacteroidales bacterium]MBQ3521651.1 deoxyribose-phosphate aldolase [Bacteroidales bacterium]MBQ6870778.1 deoxyribose-phosphate aldolase [Bacteroidales bacterium]MBQ8034551.1 deoxyribose-phosphate aldolase [Bacteroidales bacterium]
MKEYFDRFGYTPDIEEIDKKLSVIHANLDNWNTRENLSACLGIMDLTTLNSSDTPSKVSALAQKVNKFKSQYPEYPTPASICIYPNLGKYVKESLTAPDVNVTVVAAVFPNAQSFIEVKELECKMAIEQGADEVDIVLALNSFLAGDYQKAADEIKRIKAVVGNRHLKVILETGALATPENIAAASFLAMEAGADFIKTSTGKQEPAATPMAAIVMCECINAYYKKTGKKIGFKPAGGMVAAKDALCYYAIVDTILGKEWLNKELFRLGASRLANNLLSELEQKTVSYY